MLLDLYPENCKLTKLLSLWPVSNNALNEHKWQINIIQCLFALFQYDIIELEVSLKLALIIPFIILVWKFLVGSHTSPACFKCWWGGELDYLAETHPSTGGACMHTQFIHLCIQSKLLLSFYCKLLMNYNIDCLKTLKIAEAAKSVYSLSSLQWTTCPF